MTYKIQHIFVSLCLLMTVSAWTQLPDTIPVYHLEEVVYQHRMKNMMSDINVIKIDSAARDNYFNRDLSSLMQYEAGVTVVNYGATGVSNVRLRGGMSNHTAVFWNGFNIQDPLLGMFNFSNVNTTSVDEIKVQKGGASAIYGSGAIGGIVHLMNVPVYNKGFQTNIGSSIGSFGNRFYNIEMHWSKVKWAANVKYFQHQCTNDFEYSNFAKLNTPNEIYNNAYFEKNGVQAAFYKKAKNQNIQIQYWFQNIDRGSPGTMVAANQNASINEIINRLAINYKLYKSRTSMLLRSGLFFNDMIYNNPTMNLRSLNAYGANITEAIFTWNESRTTTLNLGLLNNYTQGFSDNIPSGTSQNTSSVYLASQQEFLRRIVLNSTLRRDYRNGLIKPWTYAFNIRATLNKNIDLTTNHAKSYQMPTFNDLYWKGGQAQGNMDLKDESAHSYDIGLEHKYLLKAINITNHLAVFYNDIEQMIIWMPIESIWTPINQNNVISRGLEINSKHEFKYKAIHVRSQINYTYTRSERIENLQKVQNIYVPIHQGNTQIRFSGYQYWMRWVFNFNGKMYTDEANTTFLNPFSIVNLALGKSAYVLKQKLHINFAINNLMNRNYMTRLWYPMPGRNYELGINIKFK